MARRSLRASAQGIQRFKAEMKRKKWSQTFLAGAAQCSRQTVWSLLAGKAVDADIFLQVCELLGLEADAIAEPEDEEASLGKETDINELVRQVRETLQPFLKNKFGEMKVLDMSHPIGLGDIYTDVNILSRLTGSRRISQAELLEQCNLEDFERFGFSKLQKGERVPGLQAVEQFPRLVILGKPGAGKTTFLKRITTQCLAGQIFPQQVPVFITLKQFTETKQQPNLFDYIAQQWSENGVDDADALSEKLLNQGRILLLLDGLDEVSQADSTRVIDDIRRFSERFHRNQFIVTCRIAAKEFTLEPFTEVEVADFDDQQIAVFVTKWFALKDPIKTERFLQKLRGNSRVRELATNPLLLTLLCFGFEDSGDFPVNRSELYGAGIDVLLKKWDAKRNIERDQVYRKLSLKRKEDMLSQIAWNTFEAGNYFLKQKDLERQIYNFIVNVTGASADEQELELDSEAMLKSIEAQHGLLIERAREIYSFSHLTFHEYFAAREVKEKFLFQQLASHINEYRWQEVILLTMEMVPNGDDFIYQLKQTIDDLLKDEQELQEILVWANDKTQSIKDPYNSKALRAYYLWLALPFTLNLNFTRTINFPLDLSFAHLLARLLAQNLDLDNGFAHDDDLTFFLENDLVFDLEFNCGSTFFLNLNLSHTRTLDLVLDHALTVILARALIQGQTRTFDHALIPTLAQKLNLSVDFQLQLQKLLTKLLNPDKIDQEIKLEWWETKCQNYTEQLRVLMIHHRSIGRNWCFTSEQLQKLEEYLSANLLLLACLNSDCVITRSVREDIEDTLLLPIIEIEKRKSRRD